MSYITEADLITRFGQTEITQLADRDGDGQPDTAVVDQALADADALINGHLQAVHTLPLTTVPELVKMLAGDIARYQLYEDRATETVQKRYDAAVRTLEKIAAGRMSLGLDAGAETTPQAGGAKVVADAPERTFTGGTLAGYTE